MKNATRYDPNEPIGKALNAGEAGDWVEVEFNDNGLRYLLEEQSDKLTPRIRAAIERRLERNRELLN